VHSNLVGLIFVTFLLFSCYSLVLFSNEIHVQYNYTEAPVFQEVGAYKKLTDANRSTFVQLLLIH